MRRISTMYLMLTALVFLSGFLGGCGFIEESSFLRSQTRSDLPWWDENWSYRRILTINNSGQAKYLIDFPVLVRLSSSRINYAQTQDNGEDLRFIDADGVTVLYYEIEEWNESGESVVWVRVPQIDASPTADYIIMYYGNTLAAAGQNPQAVWDAHYELVWHCGEQPAGANDVTDSTGNNRDGTTTNMEPGDRVSGHMGFGLDLDGTDEWINVNSPDPGFFHDLFSTKSFEIWINADDTVSDQTVYEEGGSTNGFCVNINGGNISVITRDSSSQITVSSGYSDTTNFNYIAGVFDNGTLYKYVNAAAQSQATGYASVGSHSGEPGFGYSPDSDSSGHGSAGYNFDGIMDEVRLSSIVRSSAWISAQYLSMTDSFITFGQEEY
jgi:hypothetical protein